MAINTFTGATDSNWGTATNWSQGTVPTASDGHTTAFDATSPACTVNASNRVCNGIDFTGYTNTITMTYNITVSGNITLASGMGILGSGTLGAAGSAGVATLTSNGRTWPNALTFSGANTFTFADDWDVDGLVTLSTSVCTYTAASAKVIYCGAGVTTGNSGNVQTGSNVTLNLNGNGTLTGGTGPIAINTTFSAGTIALSGTIRIRLMTLTYTGGTVNAGSSTVTLDNGAVTLACNGMTFNNFVFNGTGSTPVITLNENLNIAGLFTYGSSNNAGTMNGSTINCTGGVRYGGTSGIFGGTSVISLNGTQTVDSPSQISGQFNNPINIAAGTGTVTIQSGGGNRVSGSLSNLLYTSGTVVTSAGTWVQRTAPTYALGI